SAIDHRVAVLELAVQRAEAGDLGRADEGEILRPEEHDLPFARVRGVVEIAEGGFGVGRNDALQFEFGEFVTNGQHRVSFRKARIPGGSVQVRAYPRSSCESYLENF